MARRGGVFPLPVHFRRTIEPMQTVKIINLDRRFNGHSDFKYRVEFLRTADYCDAREWCWETFGPACELEARIARPGNGWCFDFTISPTRRYIYIKGDEQMTLFKLKWS